MNTKIVSSTQADPLLNNQRMNEPQLPHVKVETYDENEETTCVDVAILLQSDCIKRWLVVPLLSILSILIFPVFLYWRITMQRDWLYKRCHDVNQATHVYIEGRGK